MNKPPNPHPNRNPNRNRNPNPIQQPIPSHHHRPQPPPLQPPPLQPPPYYHRRPPKPRRSTLASCIVATIFLIFLIIILFILYFSLFKPTNPKISINAIQLPTFSLSTNLTTVSFTFSQYASVRNPNRASFSHFDSSLQLLYAGNQIGFMFIPAGKIGPGRTEFLEASFSVQSFPISTSPAGNMPAMIGPPVSDGIDRVRPTMEIESRMEIVGRTRVLWFFSHHVESVVDCRIAVAMNDGSVLGFHC